MVCCSNSLWDIVVKRVYLSEDGVTPRPTVILGILYGPSLDQPILQYTMVMIIVYSNKSNKLQQIF